MKHTIAKMTGQQLEWVLCKAHKIEPSISSQMGVSYRKDDGTYVKSEFSSDAQAGVIAGQHWISVERPSTAQTMPTWCAITEDKTPPKPNRWTGPVRAYGTSFGEAVGRAFAISVMGSATELPDELSDG